MQKTFSSRDPGAAPVVHSPAWRAPGDGRIERRSVLRFVPLESLTARLMRRQPARIVDISARGARIEVLCGLHPQASIELVVFFPDGPFTARATVLRCNATGYGPDGQGRRVLVYRAALAFDGVSEEAGTFLSDNLLGLPAAPGCPPSGTDARGRLAPEASDVLEETGRGRAAGPIRIRVTGTSRGIAARVRTAP